MKNKIIFQILFVAVFVIGLLFFPVKRADANFVDCFRNPFDQSLDSRLSANITLVPGSGAAGMTVKVNAIVAWNSDYVSSCKDLGLTVKLSNDEGWSSGDLTPPEGTISYQSSVFNVQAKDSNKDGKVPFTLNVSVGSPGSLLQPFHDMSTQKDFLARGADTMQCGFINPANGKYECKGNPDSNGSCASNAQCTADAQAAGVTTGCKPISQNQCGDVALFYKYGCFVLTANTNQKQFKCSATLNDNSCPGIDCSSFESGCMRQQTYACDQLVTIGGGGGGTTTCGAPPLEPCPTGETKEYPFEVPNPLRGGANTIAELVGIIVKWIFSIAIPIAVAVIVYSGILFLTSKGDIGKVTKAREMLKYAVIGLAVILIGSGFITLIRSILELGAGPTDGGTTTYSCDYDTKTCSADANGLYGTKASCDAACNYSAPRFSCNSDTKQCSSDPQGSYETLDACSAACNPTIYYKYSCDENQGVCYRTVGGDYDDESDCNNNCPSGGI